MILKEKNTSIDQVEAIRTKILSRLQSELEKIIADLKEKMSKEEFSLEQLKIVESANVLLTRIIIDEINQIESKFKGDENGCLTKLSAIEENLVHFFSSIEKYFFILQESLNSGQLELSKAEISESMTILIQFGLLHDIGKFSVVREKANEILFEHEQKKPLNLSRKILTILSGVFLRSKQNKYIDSLPQGIKKILSNILNPDKITNFIIDHPFVSSIYIENEINNGNLLIEGDEHKFLQMISEHTIPPNFMIQTIGINSLDYTPQDLLELTKFVDREQLVKGEFDQVNQLRFMAGPENHNSSLSELSHHFGLTSPESLIAVVVDGMQFADPRGSLKKILIDNFSFRCATMWESVNEDPFNPDLEHAFSILTTGSSKEISQFITDNLGEPFLTLLNKIEFEKIDLKNKIESLLVKKSIPSQFGPAWVENLKLSEIENILNQIGLSKSNLPSLENYDEDRLYEEKDAFEDREVFKKWSTETLKTIIESDFGKLLDN